MDLSQFAILGNPLKHTLSPLMQGAAFEAAKINATYVPLELDKAGFAAFFMSGRALEFSGFNVTVPYKELILEQKQYIVAKSPAVEAIGAANTARRTGAGFALENTDWSGFLRALRRDLQFDPKGKRVLLLGAGGSARACCYALIHAGVREIVLVNRNDTKANALTEAFGKIALPSVLKRMPLAGMDRTAEWASADLVINATSVGLSPQDVSLVMPEAFAARRPGVLYDLIYNPRETVLMRYARQAGWQVAGGLGMLLFQGAEAFEIWTGMPAPIAVMERALEKGLVL